MGGQDRPVATRRRLGEQYIYIGLGGFEGGRPVLMAEGQAHGSKFVVEALAVRCVSGGASRAVPPKDGSAGGRSGLHPEPGAAVLDEVDGEQGKVGVLEGSAEEGGRGPRMQGAWDPWLASMTFGGPSRPLSRR
jgi:hypothetical protein